MKENLLTAAALLAIPLFAFVILYLCGAKILLFHNTGRAPVTLAAVIFNLPDFQFTDDRVLMSGKYTGMIFFPHLQGILRVRCNDSSGLTWISAKPEKPVKFLLSYTELESCKRVGKQNALSL